MEMTERELHKGRSLLDYVSAVNMENGTKEWNNYVSQNDSSSSGTVKAEEEGCKGLK